MSTTSSRRPDSPDNRLPAPNLPTHLLDVIQTIWRWRKPIIITTALAFVASVAISLIMPEYFMAETRFLAISPDQSSPETIFGTTGMKPQLYGNMNDIDRLLAIAESNDLVDHLVDSFDLYTHYDIDRKSTRGSVMVRKKFFGNYEVTKTPRDAIKIEVEDKDPEMAAHLANAARDQIDYLSKKIIIDAQDQNVRTLEREVRAKEDYLVSIGDTIRKLRKEYSIYSIGTQQEVLSTELANAEQKQAQTEAKLAAYGKKTGKASRDSIAKLEITMAGLRQARINLDSQLLRLNAGMSPILGLREIRGELSRNLNDDQERLKQYRAAMKSTQPSIALLEAAQPPVIKSRPRRSLIVLGSTFLVGLFAVLAALVIENARRYRWEDLLK